MTMKRALATVEENEKLAEGIHVLALRAEGWAGEVMPGQFAMIRAPGPEPLLARPMAFMRADTHRAVFGLKVAGRGTAALAATTPGTELVVWGPLGRGFSPAGETTRIVLVGGGIGVPPLVLQAAALARAGRPARSVIVGARRSAELFGRRELAELGVVAKVATDDGSEGHHGFVTELLKKEDLGPGCLVQACGPTPMLAAIATIARARGAKAELSLEARMGCGVGACRGCMVPVSAQARNEGRFRGRDYLCLCLDGPVVEASEVEL
jgi:dihydroorotate dehydrogenase electron transfer subunit